MNKVTIFLGEQELDVFQDEEISINLSVQNIQDISKVFTDFTQGFSVPASPRNNTIFEHYYRTDIVGGADFRVRPEGRIEINGLVFRYGVIELEGVQMQKNAPYAYDITFYGQLVNLTDLFGEDYLYDLDLSAYNHDYDQETIHSGLTGTGIHSGVIIYPLITAQDVWFYESDTTNSDPNNIYWHNQNQDHGVQYYDLKPAIQLSRVVDAISSKYGITLNITDVNDYDLLYMWCHRNAGYMYKDLPYSNPWTKILAPTSLLPVTPDWWDYASSTFTNLEPGIFVATLYDFYISINVGAYTGDYNVGIFVNGVLIAQKTLNGTTATTFEDVALYRNNVAYYAIQPSTNEAVTFAGVIDIQNATTSVRRASAYNTSTQSVSGTVDVSSLMPEQKVTDFLASLCKMFNLVIIPTSETTFDLLPLGDWYATGADQNLSQYFDITESQVEKPQLYKQINFKYNETGAITGEQYRLTNNVGYGDLRSNFVFDTDEELAVEPQFDQMLFNILTDEDGGALTNILAGYAVTRELETYLGQPFLFYAPETYFIGDNPISFIDLSNDITGHDAVEVDTIWYCNASSKVTNGATTYSLNYGADIDPYLLESVNNSLYNTYWQDYVVDLYNPSRRLVRVSAILPLGKILNFDLKNKLIWNGQRWIVNTATFALTTGKAEFELLNDV